MKKQSTTCFWTKTSLFAYLLVQGSCFVIPLSLSLLSWLNHLQCCLLAFSLISLSLQFIVHKTASDYEYSSCVSTLEEWLYRPKKTDVWCQTLSRSLHRGCGLETRLLKNHVAYSITYIMQVWSCAHFIIIHFTLKNVFALAVVLAFIQNHKHHNTSALIECTSIMVFVSLSWLYCDNSYICSSTDGVSVLLAGYMALQPQITVTRTHCSKFSVTPLLIWISQNSSTVSSSVVFDSSHRRVVKLPSSYSSYHVSAHSPTCLHQ